MKAEYINPFLNATMNVIQTMAMTPVTVGKPALKEGNLSFGTVTGVIGLGSDNVQGNMVVSFDEAAILAIVSRMLYEEFSEVDHQVSDAVGEITNMICGGAKKELAEVGIKIVMATPITIVGEGIEIRELGSVPAISIPFTTEEGKFVVEASLNATK